jgi:hypothetical protein
MTIIKGVLSKDKVVGGRGKEVGNGVEYDLSIFYTHTHTHTHTHTKIE